MKVELSETVFPTFAFYSGILIVKMLLMSFLTIRQRFSKKCFANPEDTLGDKKAKVATTDPDVERVRRAHQNDLENILPFFIAGILFCFINPDPFVATWVFRVFTLARIVHTFVYAVYVVPQPSRGLAWAVGQICTLYMAGSVIYNFS